MFLLITFTVQYINGFVAQEYEAITRLVTMTIVFNAGGRIFQGFAIKRIGYEIINGCGMFAGYTIGFEPLWYTGRIAGFLICK